MGFNQCSKSLLGKNGIKKFNLHKSLIKEVLEMGVLSSFPYKSNNECSEEEEEEDVIV